MTSEKRLSVIKRERNEIDETLFKNLSTGVLDDFDNANHDVSNLIRIYLSSTFSGISFIDYKCIYKNTV